ncbi:GNAT family N-acetyltransferase [Thalassomonas sp. M1454]|uniref:GNAT family N-acetyltransferase n=1 Tax=Thalassomonas sp. M1454 TaxID=2594477 RepID=UPI00118055C9|nr:GNAT family N-acetyltransferase [Thalassomonas sp. M1454]TRX55850.1 GNAT family N-acetyltransferase [Thalassomonas sp. M1454]
MQIDIRQASASDCNQATPLIFSSGPAAFNYIFPNPSRFLKYSFNKGQSQFGFNNHYLAILDGQVVATIACFDRHQAKIMELSCIMDMAKHLGWNFWGSAIKGLRFERIVPKPIKHSLCIAHLGVSKALQNRGIGTQLINWAIEKAKIQGYQSVSLDVAQSNPGARKLYESLGFIEHRKQKSTLPGIADHATLVLTLR